MWETQVGSLGQEDPFEKGMATHSSTDREAWQTTVCGVAKELDMTWQLNNTYRNNSQCQKPQEAVRERREIMDQNHSL